jgi:hypothetical protein
MVDTLLHDLESFWFSPFPMYGWLLCIPFSEF